MRKSATAIPAPPSPPARDIADLLQRRQLPLANLATLFALIGERLTVVMGGSSGVLMSIFFTAAGQKLEQGARSPKH